MLQIIDKAVVFVCLISVYLLDPPDGLWILPVIIVLTISSLNSYIEKPSFQIVSFIIYCILSTFYSSFLLFLPLIFYDVILNGKRFVYLVVIIPIAANHVYLSNTNIFITLSFTALTTLLKLRTISTSKLRDDYISFRDKASEISMILEQQNVKLAANQDHEINVATLSERNRIAREIHDNIGHILSRCLLQIGAVIAVNKDLKMKENLTAIKDTISQAMDSIRKSVHNLHDESIDLYDQVYKLVNEFSFCPISFEYDISDNPNTKIKYCFISIVKEALSNIIKHSNATEAAIKLREHPGFYQLIIYDNGLVQSYNAEMGIGIKNMHDRVSAFKGNVNISTDKGFKIFISIPRRG